MGYFYQEHQITGSRKIRQHVGKLQANINLLASVLDVGVRKLDIKSVAMFSGAVRSGIQAVATMFGSESVSVVNPRRRRH
jgi:hypothetical protein